MMQRVELLAGLLLKNNDMQQITYINKEDLDNLDQNPDGTYKVPDDFIIYLKSDQQKIENIQAEIARIEGQVEPSDAELIEWAKGQHPYFMDLDMLNYYKDQLTQYQK